MAFNRRTFTTRAVYGLSFAGIMIAGLLWNQWSFLALFCIIHFGCWREYLRLTEKVTHSSLHIYIRLGLMLLGFGVMLAGCGDSFRIQGLGIRENLFLPVSLAGFIILVAGIFRQQRVNLPALGMAALGILYISLSLSLLIDLYRYVVFTGENGEIIMPQFFIPVITILSIWVNDTMAYLVGSFIGRTPFSKISPKKTWEGTVGGMMLAIIAVGWLLPLLFYPGNISLLYPFLVLVASVAAVAGTSGDLLESKLKRMAGVKDSGHMMPEHGGFLDRFDSLLIAIPFIWLCLRLFV